MGRDRPVLSLQYAANMNMTLNLLPWPVVAPLSPPLGSFPLRALAVVGTTSRLPACGNGLVSSSSLPCAAGGGSSFILLVEHSSMEKDFGLYYCEGMARAARCGGLAAPPSAPASTGVSLLSPACPAPRRRAARLFALTPALGCACCSPLYLARCTLRDALPLLPVAFYRLRASVAGRAFFLPLNTTRFRVRSLYLPCGR